MDIQTIALIGTSVITAASIVLKVVAPLTENRVDDKIQKVLVKVLKLISIDSDYDKDKVRLNK